MARKEYRVGPFDDGFVSRIHVAIHYPGFYHIQRGHIWDTFLKKLEKEREKIMLLDRTVEYAKSNNEMQELGWMGDQELMPLSDHVGFLFTSADRNP